MISLDNISLRYGPKVIFGEVGALIGARDRIGLVGPNGAGKTTLLRVLTGETDLDGGQVEKGAYVTIGYLPQDGIEMHGRTLFDEAATAFETVIGLQERLKSAEKRLASLDTGSPDYAETLEMIGELEHRLHDTEAHKLESNVEKVLLGLGFQMGDKGRDCGEFSGGWQMRIARGKLLLRQPSLLLLDEPTNHLDIDSIRWVENYLQNYEGALMLISHDRAFLNTTCSRIFALSRGRLDVYTGNFDDYEEQEAARRDQLERAEKAQAKKIAQTERFIERFRYKNTKARQVQSRIKMLNRIERIELEDEEGGIGFSFSEPKRCDHRVASLEQVSKSYGDKEVLRALDITVERKDRIAVVGPNGAGKSTMARILAGVEPFQEGQRHIGNNVQIAYFAQHQTDLLNPEQSVLNAAIDGVEGATETKARTVLGSFLFRGDDVFKPTKVLSGGEKNRLVLARIVMSGANFLILDEPTNHLDMRSKDILQAALMDWEGTFMIVSHDRDFLDPLVERVLEVSTCGIRTLPGNVSDYLVKVEEERAAAQLQGGANGKGKPVASVDPAERRRREAEKRRQLAPLKKEAEALEQSIAESEERIQKFETEMADPEFYKRPEHADRLRAYNGEKETLERAMQRWEEVLEEIEARQDESTTSSLPNRQDLEEDR